MERVPQKSSSLTYSSKPSFYFVRCALASFSTVASRNRLQKQRSFNDTPCIECNTKKCKGVGQRKECPRYDTRIMHGRSNEEVTGLRGYYVKPHNSPQEEEILLHYFMIMHNFNHFFLQKYQESIAAAPNVAPCCADLMYSADRCHPQKRRRVVIWYLLFASFLASCMLATSQGGYFLCRGSANFHTFLSPILNLQGS